MKIPMINNDNRAVTIGDSIAVYGFFAGDRAIFDRNCEGVSARAIFDAADASEIDELKRLILSYETCPIVLSTSCGIAFVIPSFSWSCGLFAIYAPCVYRKAIELAISKNMLGEVRVVGKRVRRIRYSDELFGQAQALSKWLTGMTECYCAIDSRCLENISEFARTRAEKIAEHIGVRIRVLTIGSIKDDERIDMGVFTAFVTIILEFIKARFADARAVISIYENDGVMCSQIEFNADGACLQNEREILLLRSIADKNRIDFMAFSEDGVFKMRFSPVIYDWSLLGIKTPDGEDLEFELD